MVRPYRLADRTLTGRLEANGHHDSRRCGPVHRTQLAGCIEETVLDGREQPPFGLAECLAEPRPCEVVVVEARQAGLDQLVEDPQDLETRAQ
eukprot:SAG22_NODE_5802_length_950_cov_0.963572_2_plen_92_part_00